MFVFPTQRTRKLSIKYKRLNESLWGYWEDTFDDNILSEIDYVLVKENLNIEVSFNSDDLHDFLNDYFKWLSDQLSCNGSVRLAEVKSFVKELLSKYSI